MTMYEIWVWKDGVAALRSTHRLYRVAKSRLDSYIRQGIGAELRRG